MNTKLLVESLLQLKTDKTSGCGHDWAKTKTSRAYVAAPIAGESEKAASAKKKEQHETVPTPNISANMSGNRSTPQGKPSTGSSSDDISTHYKNEGVRGRKRLVSGKKGSF